MLIIFSKDELLQPLERGWKSRLDFNYVYSSLLYNVVRISEFRVLGEDWWKTNWKGFVKIQSWPIRGNTPTLDGSDWPKPLTNYCQQINFLYLTIKILNTGFERIITSKLKITFFFCFAGVTSNGSYLFKYKIGLYVLYIHIYKNPHSCKVSLVC